MLTLRPRTILWFNRPQHSLRGVLLREKIVDIYDTSVIRMQETFSEVPSSNFPSINLHHSTRWHFGSSLRE